MALKEKKLTDTEWELMKICWKKNVSSVKDVHEIYKLKNKVIYATTKLMLDKLVEKEFLKREKFGPIWLYSPRVAEKKMVEDKVDKFIDYVLGGEIDLLMTIISAHKEKYSKDMEKIKKMMAQ